MTAPPKCPGCGTKLKPDWEHCPNCPLSFTEEEAPSDSPLRPGSAFRDLALPLVFAAIMGLVVWKLGVRLFGMAQEGAAGPGIDRAAGPAAPAALPAGEPSTAASPGAPLRAVPEDGGGGDLLIVAGEQRRAVAPPAPPAGEPPAAAGGDELVIGQPRRLPKEWRFRGAVYDLVTLKPVAGATVVFSDVETNARGETLSDAKGRYRAVLPPLPDRGYLVQIYKSGYAKSYADPGLESVRALGVERRKELARELAISVRSPDSLEPPSGEPLFTDFYLAPQR